MSERPPESKDEALLARLLHTAGRGPKASPEARAEVYAAVRERWQAALPKRDGVAALRPARRAWVLTRRLTLAASLLAAAIVIYQVQTPQSSPPLPFANIARIDGNVSIRHRGDQQAVRVSGAIGVQIGDALTTDSGSRIALRLENGSSLRVNSGSELEVLAADRVALRSGTVYFDSAGASPNVSFEVETTVGSVRHVGTQFETSLVGAGLLRIRVREGAVTFTDPLREVLASAGEQVHIETAGPPQRSTIAADDAAWAWVEELATLPDQAQYALPEVLTWVARETGRDVRFDDPTVQARVQTVVLYDLGNLTPDETLDVLRSTTALAYRETDDGFLVVSANR